jgi:hypothetical protein
MQRLVSCAFVLMIGCGGDDSPEDKCVALLETVCDRAVACDIGAPSHDACMREVEKLTDCSKTESVGESYGACIGDIEDASCAALFPTAGGQRRLALPATCETALE